MTKNLENRKNLVVVQNFYAQPACNFQDYQNHFTVTLPKPNDASITLLRYLLNFKTPPVASQNLSVATVKHFSLIAQASNTL